MEIEVKPPAEVLASLRYDVDVIIWSVEEEALVWLGPCIQDGKRIGLEGCCLVSAPCEWHAACAAKSSGRA